jgi:transposase
VSFPYYHSPLVDLRIPPREDVQRRPHRSTPHNITTVARVKKLVETTTLSHRDIAAVGQVDKGTVSRWIAKHGWTRPEGAAKPCPRHETRYVPAMIGRVLASRLRLQAERLLRDLEAAPAVDPAALDEALTLLARARAEQQVRRAKKRLPPTLTPEQEAKRNRRKGHDRSSAAERGWRKRYNSKEYQDWLREKIET